MSFIDLATLALHRRNEMEARIKTFVSKCDRAIEDIVKLKLEAEGFVHQLNCEPAELKERFLNCMKTLDEYTYLITDFNLSIGKLEEVKSGVEYTPVQDISRKQIMTPIPTHNIMDMLSEPAPSTSRVCPNLCPLEHKPRKISREEQTLILFSSTSCSSESMPLKNEVVKDEKEVQCQLTEEISKTSVTEPIEASPSSPLQTELQQRNLPAQTVLQTDHVYPATIMTIDGNSMWIITEEPEATCKLIKDMTTYYKANYTDLSLEDITKLTYCAFYDDDTDCYYRGLFVRLLEEDVNTAEVFLVDIGELRCGEALSTVQPLAARFCVQPPYARFCHLAGVDMLSHNKELAQKQEEFLSDYVGVRVRIEVDDNTSESLGVIVILPDNETLNDLLIKEGLACATLEKAPSSSPAHASVVTGPPKLRAALSDSQLDLACPEYDDPVEAVTGYSNRDEKEICKHYKGGPEKTCFKGTRCKKRHVLMHPDGWTLDKVEVVGKVVPVPLPAPDTWLRALVTCVAHFDRLFVQIIKEKDGLEEEAQLPEFGVILPPASLEALVRDMNSPATRIAYKPLKIMPAVGEIVAALYPCDNQWYRARVLSVTRADQNVEVQYIDYGNVVWLKEDAIRALEPRFTSLPAQAVRCLLAGVSARGHDSKHWAAAKQQLARLAQDHTVEVHVIARGYDEITVEMFDEQGYSIAEQLAATNTVQLDEYAVQLEVPRATQHVAP